MPILFHAEEIHFSLRNKRIIKKWIADIVSIFGYSIGDLNFIFASNDYLLRINKEYLKHNYYTDVITFAYSVENIISGDVFISIDQVRMNAEEFGVSFYEELLRVIIHGVLHLTGFDDQTDKERVEMRKEENKALEILRNCTDGRII